METIYITGPVTDLIDFFEEIIEMQEIETYTATVNTEDDIYAVLVGDGDHLIVYPRRPGWNERVAAVRAFREYLDLEADELRASELVPSPMNTLTAPIARFTVTV